MTRQPRPPRTPGRQVDRRFQFFACGPCAPDARHALAARPALRRGALASGGWDPISYVCAGMQMTPEEPHSLDLVAIERLVAAYRLLADPGRLRLVGALLEDRELPVRELARVASLSETAA